MAWSIISFKSRKEAAIYMSGVEAADNPVVDNLGMREKDGRWQVEFYRQNPDEKRRMDDAMREGRRMIAEDKED